MGNDTFNQSSIENVNVVVDNTATISPSTKYTVSLSQLNKVVETPIKKEKIEESSKSYAAVEKIELKGTLSRTLDISVKIKE